MLGILFRNFNRWENNIVQTAGTSAAQTAFMCVILAAFDSRRAEPEAALHVRAEPLQSFLWLTAASVLGILLAVPLRQHYIVEEKLTFADGVAAAETIIVLDARGKEARARRDGARARHARLGVVLAAHDEVGRRRPARGRASPTMLRHHRSRCTSASASRSACSRSAPA